MVEMERRKATPILSFGKSFLTALLVLFFFGNNLDAQDMARSGVVPLHKLAGQTLEKVWGDPDKSGEPFVIRIHAEEGYIILPHTHPVDENIVVVQGVWWFGMGGHFDRSALEPLELGAFGFAPRNMEHFGWSKTETTIQVHGIGPFTAKLVDPAYDLTDKGIVLLTYLLKPGTPVSSGPTECFPWKIGTHVQGDVGEGTVVGARCSPANHLTQYYVQRVNGERFWSLISELKLVK